MAEHAYDACLLCRLDRWAASRLVRSYVWLRFLRHLSEDRTRMKLRIRELEAERTERDG